VVGGGRSVCHCFKMAGRVPSVDIGCSLILEGLSIMDSVAVEGPFSSKPEELVAMVKKRMS